MREDTALTAVGRQVAAEAENSITWYQLLNKNNSYVNCCKNKKMVDTWYPVIIALKQYKTVLGYK